MTYLPYLIGLTLFVIAACILFACGAAALHYLKWFFDSIPEEKTMPEQYPSLRARMIQTFPGDSLATGIYRAQMLAKEYQIVLLLHELTAVLVCPGDEAGDIAHEWHETRKLQEKLMRCEGRGVK